MNILARLLRRLEGSRNRKRRRNTFRRFEEYTMVPEMTYIENLEIASKIKNIDGVIVECGVWRGGMSAGLVSELGVNRQYYLFDSFKGLPPARAIDGASAKLWQSDINSPTYLNNCSASEQSAREAMSKSGANHYRLIPGWFDDTLPPFTLSKETIALLRLDADWYDSTMTCLNNLFSFVSINGRIIIDDYYAWDGCSRAVHDFLSRHKRAERIRCLGGTCFIEKSSSSVSD